MSGTHIDKLPILLKLKMNQLSFVQVLIGTDTAHALCCDCIL